MESKNLDLKEILETYFKKVQFDGIDLPVVYENELNEYYSLRKGVGVRISDFYFLKITGKDSQLLLERMTTCNVSELKQGMFRRAQFLTTDANFIDRTFLMNFGEETLIIGNKSSGGKIIKWIINYRLKEDVTLEMREDWTMFEIHGAQADSFITMLVDRDLPANTDRVFTKASFGNGYFYFFTEKDFAGKRIYYFLVNSSFASDFIGFVMDNKSVFDLNFAGEKAYEKFRVEYGYPAGGYEISDLFTPFDFNLENEIAGTKRRFIGYEGVHKFLENGFSGKRKFVGVTASEKIDETLPVPLKKNGNLIGYITSRTYSPVLKKRFCLATLARDAISGRKLDDVMINEHTVNLEIYELPLVK